MEVGTVREWTEIANQVERGDDNTIPRFYMRAVQDHLQTEQQGRPIFAETPYVEIIVPGDKNNRPDVKVTDEHRKRWPSQWAKFQATKQESIEGTPIENFNILNRAQVAEFKALGILTVEALAGLSDGYLEKLGLYGRQMRERAKQYLQPPSATESELRADKHRLEQELASMKARLDSLESTEKRKPGRPAKVREEVA